MQVIYSVRVIFTQFFGMFQFREPYDTNFNAHPLLRTQQHLWIAGKRCVACAKNVNKGEPVFHKKEKIYIKKYISIYYLMKLLHIYFI